MKHFIQCNFLIIVFLVSQVAMLYFAQLDDPILGNIKKSEASIYHLIATLLVGIGYLLCKTMGRHYSKSYTVHCYRLKIVSISSKNIFKLYVLIFLGLITSIATIGAFISPREYLSLLSADDSTVLDIREQSARMGISGFFKMFNYAPLAIYLSTSALLNFLHFDIVSYKKLRRIEACSLFASLIKVLFSLDRLTLMAIFIVLSYRLIFTNKKSWKLILLILSGVFFISWVSTIRMSENGGILGLLVTYTKLSLANFQILLDKQTEFSYIGTNTFLHPLFFIFRFFKIPLYEMYPVDYLWNPAEYFNAYLFMDFSYFSILLYPVLGFWICILENRRKLFNPKYIACYYFIAFVIISFITVPFIRAAEFWFVICVILYQVNMLKSEKLK